MAKKKGKSKRSHSAQRVSPLFKQSKLLGRIKRFKKPVRTRIARMFPALRKFPMVRKVLKGL